MQMVTAFTMMLNSLSIGLQAYGSADITPFIPLKLIHLEQDTPVIYPLSTINRLTIMPCRPTTYRLAFPRYHHTDQLEDHHECLSHSTP